MGRWGQPALPGRSSVVESHVMHRWRLLLTAMAGTAMLAVGFGIAADRLVISAPPTPHLRSISDANLFASYGVKLSGTTQPPYCGLEQAVARSGWLKPGAAGCAISREAAESAAVRGSGGPVVESLLARISAPSSADIRNRLAWLVVVRGTPAVWRPTAPSLSLASLTIQPQPYICTGLALGAGCGGIAQRSPDRVVFIDAYTGQYLMQYPQFTRSNVGAPGVPPVRTQKG